MKKIFRTSILGIAGLLVAGWVNAQEAKVCGVLLDSISRMGEPFATLRIFQEKDTERKQAVSMGTTDMEGRFEQPVKGRGNFVLLISSVGRAPMEIPFSLAGQTRVNLDTLYIKDDVQHLAMVEVVAQKPLVKMTTDRMTYSVADDVDAKTNTVLDMLRKVPMVTVDGNDNISVNGSSSFQVYVDGKPNVMMSSNPSEIFKNMPASSIKNIEVITNPGARYDAEGVGGVLNLITDKTSGTAQRLDGYNATVRAMGSSKGFMGGGFFSMQKDKFSMSANVNAIRSYLHGTTASVEREQYSEAGTALSRYGSDSDMDMTMLMGNLNAGYEIDSLNLLSASFGLMSFDTDNEGIGQMSMSGGNYGQGFGYGDRTNSDNCRYSINGNVDFQHSFAGHPGRMLTLSYLVSTVPERTKSLNLFETEEETLFDLSDRYSRARTNTLENTWQVDFTTPLPKGQQLDAGLKYILRNNTSRSDYYDVLCEQQIWNEANSLDYKHKNHILAAYAEYKAQVRRLSLTAGLRYEHTWQDVESRLGLSEDFRLDYGNLVPSANLSFRFDERQNLGLAYNMRISRPGISYLNPYVNKSDPTALTYGNTDLDCEEVHNLNLVYNYYTAKWMLNLTLRQSFSGNGIAQYSFYDDQNLLNTTYGNIVESKQTGLNAYLNWNASSKARFNLNGSVSYTDLKSSQIGMHTSGWQASVMAGYQQTLPWKLRLSLNVMASTKQYNLQGWSSGFSAAMGSLSRSFLKDKLTLTLSGITPLTGSKLKMDSYSHGADFANRTNIRIPLQNFQFSISYTFGKQVKVKKAVRSIQNSDVMNRQSTTESVGSMMIQ